MANVFSLTANQLQSLFGKNTTPTAVRAFLNVFSFINQTASAAVIGASPNATPLNPGDLAFNVVSNTQLKLQYMGSDGTIRSATLTLS